MHAHAPTMPPAVTAERDFITHCSAGGRLAFCVSSLYFFVLVVAAGFVCVCVCVAPARCANLYQGWASGLGKWRWPEIDQLSTCVPTCCSGDGARWHSVSEKMGRTRSAPILPCPRPSVGSGDPGGPRGCPQRLCGREFRATGPQNLLQNTWAPALPYRTNRCRETSGGARPG